MQIESIRADIAEMEIERNMAAETLNLELYNICGAAIEFLYGELRTAQALRDKETPRAPRLATADSLTMVRDYLIEALGDHMVASTVFAKRFPTIYKAVAAGENPVNVARGCWHTEFAGSDGYESV